MNSIRVIITIGPGACHGDSGGPLLVERQSRAVVLGVTSSGTSSIGNCGGIGNPTHYTRLKLMLPWIKKYVKDLCVVSEDEDQVDENPYFWDNNDYFIDDLESEGNDRKAGGDVRIRPSGDDVIHDLTEREGSVFSDRVESERIAEKDRLTSSEETLLYTEDTYGEGNEELVDSERIDEEKQTEGKGNFLSHVLVSG